MVLAEAAPGVPARRQLADLDLRVAEHQPSSSPPAYPLAPATATLNATRMIMHIHATSFNPVQASRAVWMQNAVIRA